MALKNDDWKELVEEIRNCKKCRLHKNRRNTVPGEGSLNTKLIFIGEAPGVKEDEEGRPFVGAAGKLLTKLLENNGISREEVFITNVVKCRPPGNREPYDDEIKACLPYLTRQIAMIKPKIIVTLGRVSTKILYSLAHIPFTSMSKLHGSVRNVYINGLEIKLIATYHPAAALYNPQLRTTLEKDFKLIITVYREDIRTSRTRTLLDFFR